MTKLLRIHCDYFRSLYKFDLPLQMLNILIGKNDSGKSNVLRAIRLLLEDDATQEVKAQDWSKLAKVSRYPRSITITGVFEDSGRQFSVRRCISLQGAVFPATSILEIQTANGWQRVTASEQKWLPSFYYLRPKTGALQESLNPLQEHHLFSLTKAWMPKDLQEESGLDKLMRSYGTSQVETLGAYIKFIENEVEPHLSKAFPSDFSRLKINPEFRGGQIRNQLMIRELEPGDTRARIRLPLDYHGTALISVLAIIFSIAVLEQFQVHYLQGKSMIVGVEEPEVHLHPQVQRYLLNYFRQVGQKHQLLITTHSPIFVDRAQPENVTLLKRSTVNNQSNGGAKAGATLSMQKVYSDNWQRVSRDLGIKLSDALMIGEVVVLVEGQSEAVILPAIIERLTDLGKPSIDLARAVIIVGGGSNLPSKVEPFQSLNTPVFAFLDNDRSGRQMHNALRRLPKPVDEIFIPDSSITMYLPAPMNSSVDVELEDLFDAEDLLNILNTSFSAHPHFAFLPISHIEFQNTQNGLKSAGKEFGWVATVDKLMQSKSGSGSRRSFKHDLAQYTAQAIRSGTIPIPDFYSNAITMVANLLDR